MIDYAASEDGVVLLCDGLNKVRRWDGYADAVTEAGVRAPTDTPVLAGSGTGSLSGTYRCFVRYVDRYGNYSDPTPFSAEVTISGDASIDYSNLPVPTQSTVARRQILRNTDGQFLTFYVDIDTTDLVDTTLSSTRTDADLATQEQQPLQSTSRVTLYNRFAQPPSHITMLAFSLGRMFGAGVRDYAEGSVQVVNSTTNFTVTGGTLTDEMVGRFMHVSGADQPYEIATVNVSTGAGTFTSNYAGDTDPYAAYSIRPDPTYTNTVFYSDPLRPESWPAVNAFTVREDGDVITALIPYDSFLFIAKRRLMYKLTAQSNPETDGFVFPSVGRGCVNNRCWAHVDGVVFVLDERGVYRFDGGSADPLSPPIQDVFRGLNRDGLRINWRASRHFHCVADPREEVVRWFVCVNGSYLPRVALSYAYNLDRWSIDEMPFWIGGSCNGRIGRPTATRSVAEEQVYLAGRSCQIFALGRSNMDVIEAQQPAHAGRLADATALTLTLAGDVGWEVVGAPVTIIDGRGRQQTRLIAASPGDALVELDQPLTVIPDPGDRYSIGGIPYLFKTHRLDLAEREEEEELSLTVGYDPQQWGTVAVRRYVDHSPDPVLAARDMAPKEADAVSAKKGQPDLTIDLTDRRGAARVRSDRHRELGTPGARSVRYELSGVSGRSRHTFNSLKVRGAGG